MVTQGHRNVTLIDRVCYPWLTVNDP